MWSTVEQIADLRPAQSAMQKGKLFFAELVKVDLWKLVEFIHKLTPAFHKPVEQASIADHGTAAGIERENVRSQMRDGHFGFRDDLVLIVAHLSARHHKQKAGFIGQMANVQVVLA